jgi:hypothetical protein
MTLREFIEAMITGLIFASPLIVQLIYENI